MAEKQEPQQQLAQEVQTPAATPAAQPAKEPDAEAWPVVGWIQPSKSGKSYLVWDHTREPNVLLGSVNAKTLWKLLQGEVKAAPIKAPRPE